jgi:nitrate/nitrite transporter NarK
MAMAALLTHGFVGSLVGLILASIGVFAALPVFWTAATEHMGSASRAVAIAFINSVGNTAGFVGPAVIGIILQHTGSYRLGLLFTAAVIFFSAILIACIPDRASSSGVDAEHTS